MDVPLVVRHRLKSLGFEQRDLAKAAEVTESYISQLLARKKAPPAPNRTDIYEKMERFLRLPAGDLSRLAEVQRKEDLQKTIADSAGPMFKEVRELILRKCRAARVRRIRRIFEKDPFGELERLVTQKLLDVAQRIARAELGNESWLRQVAKLSQRSYEELRVVTLDFLDTDIFNISVESCITFLDPLIESWDIDLASFGVEIMLNRSLTSAHRKTFEFVEKDPDQYRDVEPGFEQFRKDVSLSGDASSEEIDFLKRLRFAARRPTPLYYYRELQSLRDPLHFRMSK